MLVAYSYSKACRIYRKTRKEARQRRKMLKSKKGFTLIELTVVLAVTAIVVTMICGFIISYQNQSLRIVKNSDIISDVNRFKETVGQWIDENDDGATVFDVSSHKIKLGENSLSFDSGKLTIDGGPPIAFKTLSDCEFSKRDSIDNVIYCELTAKAGKQDRKIQLLFDVYYNYSKERS